MRKKTFTDLNKDTLKTVTIFNRVKRSILYTMVMFPFCLVKSHIKSMKPFNGIHVVSREVFYITWMEFRKYHFDEKLQLPYYTAKCLLLVSVMIVRFYKTM